MGQILNSMGEKIRSVLAERGLTRTRKHEIERELKKKGASQEQIDYALFLEGNREKADEIFTSTLKLLCKLGYSVEALIQWTQSGCRARVSLEPMHKQIYDEISAQQKAQEEAEEAKREEARKATEAEEETAAKLEGRVCDPCIYEAGSDECSVCGNENPDGKTSPKNVNG